MDQLFDSDTTQEKVFESVARPLADQVLSGFNATMLAYGATGTGKTHTMIGERSIDGTQAGIVPRTMEYMIRRSNEDKYHTYTFHISFVELYNKTLTDLLDPSRTNLKIQGSSLRLLDVTPC